MSENKRVTIPFLVKVLKPIADLVRAKADKTDIVQSDWNQTDETKNDFIKNKPEITSPVQSVNGKVGEIVLTPNDIGAQPAGDYALKSEIPSTEGLATETYVNTKVAGLVDSAPETLDTLNELAAALGDDPNFATTLATQIGEIQAALTINYDSLAFDTTEIVFNQNTSVILGQAMLGQTVLG